MSQPATTQPAKTAAASSPFSAFDIIAGGKQATVEAVLAATRTVLPIASALQNPVKAAESGTFGPTAQIALAALRQEVSAVAKFMYWLLAIITFGIFIAIKSASAAKIFGAGGSLANAIKSEFDTDAKKAEVEALVRSDIESGKTLEAFGNSIADPSENGYIPPDKASASPAAPASGTPGGAAPASAPSPAPAATTPPAQAAVKDAGAMMVAMVKAAEADETKLAALKAKADELKESTTTEIGRQNLVALFGVMNGAKPGEAKSTVTLAQYKAFAALTLALIAVSNVTVAKKKHADEQATLGGNAAGYKGIFANNADDPTGSSFALKAKLDAVIDDANGTAITTLLQSESGALAKAVKFDGTTAGDDSSTAAIVLNPLTKSIVGMAVAGDIANVTTAANALKASVDDLANNDTDFDTNATISAVLDALNAGSLLSVTSADANNNAHPIVGTDSSGLNLDRTAAIAGLKAVGDAAVAIAQFVLDTANFPEPVKTTFTAAATGPADPSAVARLLSAITSAETESTAATNDAMTALTNCFTPDASTPTA
ncbi:MAG: hypothetical protein LBI39_02065 [Puniceicoccales bacterium]|jgi:hypothetical protein|nr:hypothetical protein [Puniceicoccales bacterium]